MTASLKLHPGQYTALASRAPITLVIGGIRAGKTHLGAIKTILNAVDSPCELDECHAVCSPTYPMSTVPIEKMFALLYNKNIFPVSPLIKYYKRDRVFVFRTKTKNKVSRVRVFSMHEPDRIRGFKVLSVWYDEGAYGSLDSWRIIQGRVADTSGPIWVTTTPAGYNWVHDVYNQAVEEQKKKIAVQDRTVRVVHFSSLENVFIKDRSGFERLLNSYDEKTYNQEVLARFTKATGLVYYTFSGRNIAPGSYDSHKSIFVGQDFNISPMASAIAQEFTNADGERGLHFLQERKVDNSNTFALISFLENLSKQTGVPKGKIHVVPDASSKARSTSGKSDFELLKAAGFVVDAPSSNPFIKDRVNCVNSMIAPRLGKSPRLLVDPQCTNIINSFNKQTYEEGSDPPVPEKEHGFDHMADAVGYLCHRRFPVRASAFKLYSLPDAPARAAM